MSGVLVTWKVVSSNPPIRHLLPALLLPALFTPLLSAQTIALADTRDAFYWLSEIPTLLNRAHFAPAIIRRWSNRSCAMTCSQPLPPSVLPVRPC